MADARAHQVLITRPEPAATATAQLVAALGFEPVLTPLLAVRQHPVRVGGAVDAVLVTSGNAIPALPASLHGVRLLAVGEATAARAAAAGFSDIRHADGDAAALAALARRALPPGTRLLLASGAGQGGALAAALRSAGFRVRRRIAYSARPVPRLPDAAAASIGSGRLHAAMFLSAETACAFVRLLPPPLWPHLATVEALAIGEAAAAALAPLPWTRVRVSVRPTLEEVLALL